MSEIVPPEEVLLPPFDSDIHLKCMQPTEEQKVMIAEFRTLFATAPFYENHVDWADDIQIFRFLLSRNFNMTASLDLMKGALKWRQLRKPSDIESSSQWPHGMSKESETGKIYHPGHDKWGRSVLVFDN